MRALAFPFALVLTLAALAPRPALADPCDASGGMFQGPIALGYEAGGLGLARRACPRTTLRAGAGGAAIVEVENFYGWIHGGLALSGSWALDPDTEVFGSLEALRVDYVQSSLSATRIGLGLGALGLTRRLAHDEAKVLSGSARLVLPTALGLYQGAVPLGLDLGLNGLWRLAPAWEAYGHLGGLGVLSLSGAPAGLRLGAVATLGAAWRPLSWLALAAETRGAFAETAPVDVVDAALAARLAFGAAGLELAVRAPLLGRERSLAAFQLAFGWRW